jgi:hypothetical protein
MIMPRTNKAITRTASPVVATSTITREEAQKIMAKAPNDKVFWSNDGRILTDLRDLVDALANMSDQTFAYHSNAIKKDFSNWVRDILEDDKLAGSLERASNREDAARIVGERCAFLSDKLNK